MKKIDIQTLIIMSCTLVFFSCGEDFLERTPLDSVSSSTYWETEDQAEFWVNTLYNGMVYRQNRADAIFEAFSDNAYGRAGEGATNIAKGTYEPNDAQVRGLWDYTYIRHGLEFFENIGSVTNISDQKLTELSGQVHFHLAFQYNRLISLYRDVPLVIQPLTIAESDVPKNNKEEVLTYILEQLDLAIAQLPVQWPGGEVGKVTKGAALALKARVLLYNERWTEAANAAKQVIESEIYELHPNFREVFMAEFNNNNKEVILANQYAENAKTQENSTTYAPVRTHRGFALILPTKELDHSFEMIDGLSIEESPLYDETKPFENRDPRYYDTFLYQGAELNGTPVDIIADYNFALTYIYFKKHIQDFKDGFRPGYANWPIIRFADVLLMYAEAQNEASGPDDSVYEALNLIRQRAGMPEVDQEKYSDQASLRSFIRNERRVELAGEGLRFFDIRRWRIAEETMNTELMSLDPEKWENRPALSDGSLIEQRLIETRVFQPKNYVWPIPQDAIDRSKGILVQHEEW